jgi:hypothetical protein
MSMMIRSLKTRRASDLAMMIVIITDLVKMTRAQLALLRVHQLNVIHERRRRRQEDD